MRRGALPAAARVRAMDAMQPQLVHGHRNGRFIYEDFETSRVTSYPSAAGAPREPGARLLHAAPARGADRPGGAAWSRAAAAGGTAGGTLLAGAHGIAGSTIADRRTFLRPRLDGARGRHCSGRGVELRRNRIRPR